MKTECCVTCAGVLTRHAKSARGSSALGQYIKAYGLVAGQLLEEKAIQRTHTSMKRTIAAVSLWIVLAKVYTIASGAALNEIPLLQRELFDLQEDSVDQNVQSMGIMCPIAQTQCFGLKGLSLLSCISDTCYKTRGPSLAARLDNLRNVEARLAQVLAMPYSACAARSCAGYQNEDFQTCAFWRCRIRPDSKIVSNPGSCVQSCLLGNNRDLSKCLEWRCDGHRPETEVKEAFAPRVRRTWHENLLCTETECRNLSGIELLMCGDQKCKN